MKKIKINCFTQTFIVELNFIFEDFLVFFQIHNKLRQHWQKTFQHFECWLNNYIYEAHLAFRCINSVSVH